VRTARAGTGSLPIARITIDVHPSASPNQVTKWYRDQRAPLQARHPRPPKRPAAKLVEFVDSRPAPITWKQRASEWDREYPELAYGQLYNNMLRDYSRARAIAAGRTTKNFNEGEE